MPGYEGEALEILRKIKSQLSTRATGCNFGDVATLQSWFLAIETRVYNLDSGL